ncbi:MAG: arylesterase [Bdellovibrionales bacterium]
MFNYFLILIVSFSSVCAFAKIDNKDTKAQKILIIGDSLTAGYGVSKKEAYPKLLEEKLRKNGFNYEVVNAGSSGSTTAGCIKRLRWQMRGKLDLLMIALGPNDGLRGFDLEASKKNLVKCVSLAKSKKIPVVLAGMEIPINYGEKYRDQFRSMYKEISQEQGIKLLKFLLVGVAGERKLNIEDGIHPNASGHEVISKTVFQFLKSNQLLKNNPKDVRK